MSIHNLINEIDEVLRRFVRSELTDYYALEQISVIVNRYIALEDQNSTQIEPYTYD